MCSPSKLQSGSVGSAGAGLKALETLQQASARASREAVTGEDASRPTSAWRRSSVEDVPEAGAVAEAPQLDAEHRAVRTVLGAGHVAHVGLPAARMPPAFEALAPASTDRGRVFVAVVVVAGREVAEQSVAAGVGAGAGEDEDTGAAPADRRPEVPSDVRVSRLGESDVLHAPRLHAGGLAAVMGTAGAGPGGRAWARQVLAIDAVAVAVAGVPGTLRGGLVEIVGAHRGGDRP